MLSSVLLLVALLLLWSGFWKKWYRPTTRSDEVHWVRTEDNWSLALSRYRPRTKARRYPVLLCPGLASNRFTFDLREELSLARTLSNLGFDVWTLELRGHGLSDRPALRGEKRFGFDFQDYLTLDLPAALSYVREQSQCEKVHALGHSMGGILFLCHQASTRDEGVASITSVGSSLHLHQNQSWYRFGLRLRGLSRWLPCVPFGWSSLVAPLAGHLPGNHLEEFLLHTRNTRSVDIRRILSCTFHAVSTPVLLQLAGMLEEEGLRSRDGVLHYASLLESIETPVLMIGADLDHQCPQVAVESTFQALRAPQKALKVFGRDGGQERSYGHFDLLNGERVNEEVFPEIARWLQQHDPAQEDS